MPPPLPPEILNLIVDHVGVDGGQGQTRDFISLCMSGRAFVACCQSYIFRSVTLYPPSSIPESQIPPRIANEYRKTLLFAKSILRRPALALYVQELNYRLTSTVRESDVGFTKLLDALQAMTNVSKLSLGFDDSVPIMPFLAITSPSWKRTIFGLIRSKNVRHLTLRNVFSVPSDAILNGSSFNTLELYNTELITRKDGRPHLRLPNRYLTSLTCDAVSLVSGTGLSTSLGSPGFPCLEKLDVTVSSLILRGLGLAGAGVLLRRSTDLRELQLTVIEVLKPGEPLPCLLDELNRDCVASLTCLTFTGVFSVGPRHILPQHVHMTNLPCRGLTDSTVFPQLTQLESLTIRIIVQTGFIYNLVYGIGSQWASIVDVLKDPYTFPVLRNLTVEIVVRVLDDEGETLVVPKDLQADSLLSNIRKSVYPMYLSPLEDLYKGGEHVDFVFRSLKEEGHRLHSAIT